MSMDSNLQLGFQSVAAAIKLRQEALVSGTNICTVNGNSLLGSTDISIPTYANVISTTNVFFTASGSKAWTVNNIGAFVIGSRVRVIDQTDFTRWMEGVISYTLSDTYVLVNVDSSSVTSGSSNSWIFSIAGEPGIENVFIQATEPPVALGKSALWVERLPNGNFSCWIKTE